MNIKKVAALCAALCSTGAFAAATPVACPATPANLDDLINKCAPEVTFYVAGASAQSGALNALLDAGGGVFDTAALRAKITDTATSVSGIPAGASSSNTVAWIGYGAAGTAAAGKRVIVIYNKANGSAAGVNQLLTGKGGSLEEVTLVTAAAKSLAKGTAGTCAVLTPSTAGSLGTASCATEAAFKSAWGVDAQKNAHLALSDVRPSELVPGIVKKWDATKFPATTTAMQGFGVIVNAPLYSALITKNIAEGVLPASCASETIGNAVDTITGGCQPSIRHADYSSIVTGKIKTADALLGTTGNTTKIALYRRVNSSGTQAASNIFFAGQAGYNVKTPTTDGYVTPIETSVDNLNVTLGSTTGDVIGGVSGNTADYALGVVSLENVYSLTKASSKLKGAAFVKIDGISPNFKADGTLDAKHRVGLQNGYAFAFEMQAVKPSALAGAYNEIATKIIDGLKDPAANLAGLAYIGSTDTAKNTDYTRGGVNYQPLTK
jgi:hypothetical protein